MTDQNPAPLECPICGRRQVDRRLFNFHCAACHRTFHPDEFKALARLKVNSAAMRQKIAQAFVCGANTMQPVSAQPKDLIAPHRAESETKT